MKRLLIITGVLLVVVAGGAGGAVYYWGWDSIERVIGSNEPKAIAKRFWKTTLSGRQGAASWYMKPMEGLVPQMAAAHEDDEVILGSAVQQDGYQFIDTTLVLNRPSGRRVVRLKTVMVPDDGGEWLVDFWSSQQTALDVGLEDGLQRMTALLTNASAEFPHLFSAGGGTLEEAKKAAGEQIDVALNSAKEQLLDTYTKQLEHLSKTSKAAADESPSQASAEVPSLAK